MKMSKTDPKISGSVPFLLDQHQIHQGLFWAETQLLMKFGGNPSKHHFSLKTVCQHESSLFH